MPNHIKTILRFVGPIEDVRELRAAIRNPKFDLKPSKEFPELASPCFMDFEKIIPPPEGVNWYDWNIKNWGTKWNAYTQASTNERNVFYQTAWSFSQEIVQALSKKFPALKIYFRYADEDRGSNCGKGIYANGVLREWHDKEGDMVFVTRVFADFRKARAAETFRKIL